MTKPSPLERLSTAMSSSDLTVVPDRRTDVDYVVALGIAESRNNAAAGPLARLYLTSSRTALRRAYESVGALVAKLNLKRRWKLTDDEARVVTKQALMHHVSPTCPACHGRGAEVHEGAPILSGRICKPCRGSGKRPVQKKHHDEIVQVITVLETIDQVTEDAVARLVRQ